VVAKNRKGIINQEERLCDVPGCGGEQKGKYMTVNLSLIVGHIRKLEGAFSQGMVVLEGVGGGGRVVILRGRC